MKSKVCLSLLVLLVCQGIFYFNQVEAEELTALDFEQIDFLFPVENIETSSNLSGADTVLVNEEEGTASPGENTEGGEDNENGSEEPGEEIKCADTNCEICTTANLGACTTCKDGYEPVSGTCKIPVDPSEVPKKTGKLSSKIRFGGNLEIFNNLGGKLFAQIKLAAAMGLDVSQVIVTDAYEGSIIVAFDLYTLSSSTLTVAQLKSALDTMAKNKDSKLDIFETGISDYFGSSIVVTEGGCPTGYYADGNDVCQTCEEGCDTCESDGKCKKTNVGAIVGGVLGGVALVLVLVIAYIKRDVLLKGLSSLKSSNRSAAYTKADNQA